MRNNLFCQLHRLAICVLCVLAVAGCRTAPQGPQPEVSTVMRLDGLARYSADKKHWKALQVGDVIEPGSVVQTAIHDSYLILSVGEKTEPVTHRVNNGTVYDPAVHPANLLLLGENTVVRMDAITSDPASGTKNRDEQIALFLVRGEIQGNVKKRAPGSVYEVKFTNGVVTMGEGTYRLDAAGKFSVLEGRGTISFVGRNITNTLSAAQMFDFKTATVTNLAVADSPLARHDMWLPSDPIYVPWANELQKASAEPSHPPDLLNTPFPRRTF